uniref:Uncharacterized protein n=1 Tax=Amphimedon queenslandica TaxID=400682 RepID=A0A1X7SVK3_AMPQE
VAFELPLDGTDRSVFLISSLISTDPQLNIVSSGSVTIVSVKPWDTRNITTSCFMRTTSLAIPEWIRCI